MMSGVRVSALVLGAGLFAFGSGAPVSAQGLSQYGMWGSSPPTSRSPSFLGAAPSAPQAARGAELAQGGGRPSISPKSPQRVSFDNRFEPGSVVIDTASRKLYYTLSQNSAYVYPVAVGRQGFAWTGVERVSRIQSWPDWHPPAEMRRRDPRLPVKMTGGVRNPLGAKAIYLGNTLYRIHGTNETRSIGTASSSGCFRMHNGHVVHLAGLVDAGTAVYVVRSLPKSGPAVPPGGPKPQQPTVQEASVGSPASDAEAGAAEDAGAVDGGAGAAGPADAADDQAI